MKYIVHGHFYQPPREDPISNQIPHEKGSAPYDNWNERITAECYKPNAKEGNFGKISFNIGPTLFDWLVKNTPETAEMIIAQERENYTKHGVGNGMAQAYNHSILPLQSRLDKLTQVRWGVEEFKFRFGHAAQGMWLPETGVDLETLCVLSDCGLTFTILAPWQINPVKSYLEDGPFLIDLPGNRPPFVVFPYDREYSTMISFLPKSTENGDRFLQGVLRKNGGRKGVTLFASDGELYGHHQRFRDLFLSYILGLGSKTNGVDWTYPGLVLKENDIHNRATLVEPSSWSCLHGVGRWERDCGCTPGSTWKLPMRKALNAIAEWVDARFLEAFSPLGPLEEDIETLIWELRHGYVEVVLGLKTLDALGSDIFGRAWDTLNFNQIETLMEAQVERQKMFTSCGWFFDDFNRIEPANNIAYAAKAVWLCQQVSNKAVDESIFALLRETKSPVSGLNAENLFVSTLERAERELSKKDL